MFYDEKSPDKALRFGDIVSGYILASPKIKQPILEKDKHEYNINIELSPFSAILSPSCSIGEKKITLSPLILVRKTYFENPYLRNDLTRLNRQMERRYAHNPEKKEKGKDTAGKDEKYLSEIVWAFVEFYVYDQHEKLPPYTVRLTGGESLEIRYYMIDFRNIHKIDCDEITEARCAASRSLVLQLSNSSRRELIEKIKYYYERENTIPLAIPPKT